MLSSGDGIYKGEQRMLNFFFSATSWATVLVLPGLITDLNAAAVKKAAIVIKIKLVSFINHNLNCSKISGDSKLNIRI